MQSVTRGGLAKPHDWHSSDYVGGPFDLAVSAICLHNLRDDAKIFACYRAIHDLLKPGAWFFDYDLFFDGVDGHLRAMREAGFSRVECRWQEQRHAIIAAGRADS